jgi:hypothetical protein
MAEEEKSVLEAGVGIVHDVSAGTFLNLGMDIQVLQCVCSQYGAIICTNSPFL